MTFNSIISCLKDMSKLYCFKVLEKRKLCNPFIPNTLRIILNNKKGSKDIYNVLNRNNIIPTAQEKLTKIYKLSHDQWHKIYMLPFVVTKNTKLQWLQFRVNHNILVTNHILGKIKILDSQTCSFCHNQDETIEHILWDCPTIQKFLNEIESWFKDKNVSDFQSFSKTQIRFGDTENACRGNAFNFILLIIKYYIYTQRCLKKSLSLCVFKTKLKDMYQTEKMISVKKQIFNEFQSNWRKFEVLFTDI